MKSFNYFLFTAFVFLLHSNTIQVLYAQNITLEDLWLKGTYRSTSYYDTQWHPNQACLLSTTLQDSIYTIWKNDFTLQKKPWLQLTNIQPESFIPSPDTQSIVLLLQEEPIYRRSSKYWAYLYLIETQELRLISDTSLGKISNLSYAPNGRSIAFCRNNNLFVLDLSTFKETAITSDGAVNEIIHGSADWVYEEEFEFTKAYVWSQDGRSLAWYRFDERKVKEYNLQYYYDSYPQDYRFKYPRAGEDNSSIQLWTYSLSLGTKKMIADSDGRDIYFPRLYATQDPSYFLYFELNRTQNHLQIFRYHWPSGKSEKMYEEQNDSYVEINDNIAFYPRSTSFIFTSERSGFRHLWKVEAGNAPRVLTQGPWEVAELYGLDATKSYVYFSANKDQNTGQAVYRLDLKKKTIRPISATKGWTDVIFAPDFSYYLEFYSTLHTPPTVHMVQAHTAQRKMLVNNSALEATLSALPKATWLPMRADSLLLNAWMLTPADFKTEKKYPVILTVYGGPGHRSVTDRWGGANYFWYQILAQHGYIIVAVDGRGTGGKGAAFKKCTQGKLGVLESSDMAAVARQLSSLEYVDANRIGIFGWSFGGYLSTMCLTKESAYFKTGIAVAPVSDWKFYDNIYTERYMNTPGKNPEGYAASSVLNYASKLKGNLLLIHGTGDDNVHVQHSYALQDAFIQANKQVDMFIYPNRNHSIYGGYTRYHLYKRMTDYFLKNL
ncbi:MAG: S9 family peptidase [Cytophagaceae bacterium]|jgi:dipeptidyl-peptidase-4|nr:S9 family peptidase [Cytophagaceae bacterium]